MIITLTGANFSGEIGVANIGTISSLGQPYNVTVTCATAGATITITASGMTTVTSTSGTATMSNIPYGTVATYTVSASGYTTKTGTVTSTRTIPVTLTAVGGGGNTPTQPTTYTFTINPTPSDATVTLTASGYTQSGNSITVPSGTSVTWKVSKTGYTEQTGTHTVTKTESKNIELSESGTVVNLTAANAINYSTTEIVSTSQTPGSQLATNAAGTVGIYMWEIPAMSRVKLTVAGGGNYGMALTDENNIVLEAFLNSTVAPAAGSQGEYIFNPVKYPTKLYVSKTKFVVAEYTVLSEEDFVGVANNIMVAEEIKDKFVATSQTVGSPVVYSDMGSSSVYVSSVIPENVSIEITVNTGGNYGFALCDTSGNVLAYTTNSKADDNLKVYFPAQSVETILHSSKTKYKNAVYIYQ